MAQTIDFPARRDLMVPRFEFVSHATDEQREAGLPVRATEGSAGYDFIAPFDIRLSTGEDIIFETGIKVFLPENTYLKLKIRSSLAIKRGINLLNDGAIIDSDYVNSAENEGNIIAALYNTGRRYNHVVIRRGEPFMQGIITPYLRTYDDNVTRRRTGGIGSTSGGNCRG